MSGLVRFGGDRGWLVEDFKRIGDSHLVWFVGGDRSGVWESYSYLVDAPDEGKSPGPWFQNEMLRYEDQRDCARGRPPSWGPLAKLWAGAGPRTGLDPSLGHVPVSGLSSYEAQQRAAGWPFRAMGYWSSETRAGTYRHFFGWRPAWYAKLARNRSWALPLWPIWPRFVANGATYFAVLLACAMLLSNLRRISHYRHGRCAECRYDLRGGSERDRCPECGWVPRSQGESP
jgi:hypothetical protein